MIEGYVQRMLVEKHELESKISKLEIYIKSYAFSKLDRENQKLLNKQLNYMMGYLNVLTQRIILNGGCDE